VSSFFLVCRFHGVVADLPVGQRLQDQPGYANAYALAPGYLEMTPARDARRMLEGVKIGRAIARNPIFAPFVAAELTPGDAVADDDTLAQNIAANVAHYGHPTSTAPMGGSGDPWAVVDSVGAVKGVSGLRVADVSIIPEVPSSTTNVTVIMLAERIYQRVYAS
jgi:choline dehydrogenase